MTKQALIIFVRNPIPGKVKTRLAATVGDQEAVNIYMKMLQHTHVITRDLLSDKFLWYADEVNTNDLWENNIYKKQKQDEGELGIKMSAAFEDLFNKGYKRCCIIGSDCMQLTAEIIDMAFSHLQQSDVVIGPSADGGYYLLGMNKYTPQLFRNKEWSTNSVFTSTLADIKLSDLSFELLPELHDIDTEPDWIKYRQQVPI